MDVDGDDAEYALLPPAAQLQETITRQLQREIMGKIGTIGVEDDSLDALQEEKEDKTEEDEPTSTPLRNCTLHDVNGLDYSVSLYKETELKDLEDALQGAGEEDTVQKKSGTATVRDALETSDLHHTPQGKEQVNSDDVIARERSTEEEASESSPSSRSANESATKVTSPDTVVEKYRKSTSFGSTIDSLTDSMFAPNLLEQDLLRRATLDLTEAAVAGAELEKETSSVTLNPDREAGPMLTNEAEIMAPVSSKQANSKNASSPSKENEHSTVLFHEPTKSSELLSLIEQAELERATPPTEEATKKHTISDETIRSPYSKEELASRNVISPSEQSDVGISSSSMEDTESRKSLSPACEDAKTPAVSIENAQSPSSANDRATGSESLVPTMELRTRKSPSTPKETMARNTSPMAKKAKGKNLNFLTKRKNKRRMTVDPRNELMTLDKELLSKGDRRQTIDNGMLTLRSAPNSSPSGKKVLEDKPSRYLLRKRGDDIDARAKRSKKRTRADSTQKRQSVDSTDLGSPVLKENSAIEQIVIESITLKSSAMLQPSRLPIPSLFSPPPGEARIRTPLKGILSARKDRRNSSGAVQTTPNKSVNFGPSQGAEFNHGSPSTSMTPMPANDASRLFPLEQLSSNEELDDDETSLNSSILDEADSLDDGERNSVSVHKVVHIRKSGFDLLQSRRSSLMALRSNGKSQKPQSMRGFSPLYSRGEIRRRRRQTINVTRQVSESSTQSLVGTDESKTNSQSLTRTRSNSSLHATNPLPTSRIYADSSTSSDAGEDMDITGEYLSGPSRESEPAVGTLSALSTNLTRDEDTAEYSLGHLLAESSVYELTKSAPESDLLDLPGTLGDLANEVAHTQNNHAQQSDDHDAKLDAIEEANETSRNHSSMSLVFDESDDDCATSRTSLQVNLKSHFDRVSEPSQSPRLPASPASLSAQLITMEELLSSITLEEIATTVEESEAFFGGDVGTPDTISRDVKLACAHDICSEVIERHASDVSMWSLAVAEELKSLLGVKAPACFCPESLDDAGRKAIQELYATEALVARTGWCQLQVQMEHQLTSSLSVGADALARDVKSLKDSVANDAFKRQEELTAIKETIDREEQMALLLDAVEEQQGAHDEYVKAVEDLENECSSLLLEESVLQSRLKVLEGRAAELEPVTSAATALLRQEVLATEEMLAIQESMSLWKIHEATASLLRLSARLEDVLFNVEICVVVNLGVPLTSGASTSIEANEHIKQRKGNTYLPYEGDVVLVLQRLLLNPHYISQIADESELGDGNDGRICSKLQVLEHFISRSFRLLKELRDLSTHFAMRYDEDGSTLWVDFLKFSSVSSIDNAHFSVGFSLLPVFPYTDYQTNVQVPRGKISTEAVIKEIELVSRHEPMYFTRVCRRLHEVFAC